MLPAAALEPIDEGEVSLGAGSLALQQECTPVANLPFDSTTVVTSGTVKPDSIQNTFEENIPALSAAYLRGLAQNRCLAGSVRVHVDTAASGLVSRVELEFSNPGLAVIRTGLKDAISRFHFELTGTPARFSYTLNLHPK